MSDPKRLLSSDSDADTLERELLASLHDDGPSSQNKAAMWNGLIAAGVVSASTVAAGTAVASSSVVGASTQAPAVGAIASSALPKAMLLKVALVTALGGASAAGIVLYQADKPAARPTAARVEPAPRVPIAPSVTSEPTDELAKEDDTPQVVLTKTKVARSKRGAADLLARESALLTEARAALRSGNTAAAQRTIDLMTREFPRGVLAQEREVLTIDVLLALGKRAEAQASAARFVARHPESPHSVRLARLSR